MGWGGERNRELQKRSVYAISSLAFVPLLFEGERRVNQ